MDDLKEQEATEETEKANLPVVSVSSCSRISNPT
jgi:hypothetical protein